MSTIFHDTSITIKNDLEVEGALTLGATQALPGVLAVPFARDQIQAGTAISAGLPANALILGCYIVITTALGFSAGTTTGVSAKVGNSGDDDGYGTSTALAGAAGYRRPAPGALNGAVVAGSTGGLVVTFTATGGTPSLSEVSEGVGSVFVVYATV